MPAPQWGVGSQFDEGAEPGPMRDRANLVAEPIISQPRPLSPEISRLITGVSRGGEGRIIAGCDQGLAEYGRASGYWSGAPSGAPEGITRSGDQGVRVRRSS